MRPLRHFRTNRCYHLISRIANRALFLTSEERTRFVDRLWRVADFSGVEVLAYCFLDNHFHILVYIPEPSELSDCELLSRVRKLYFGDRMAKIEKEWVEIVRRDNHSSKENFRKKFLRRMWNVSEFMKTLKQNSTISYNSRSTHTGTMWESRFRAREYKPDEKVALMNVAGYIDRNPVKAKIVSWPDQYAWCSFSAACKGDKRCIDGYRFIYSFAPLTWSQLREQHEKSIHLVLKELEDDRLSGPAKKGLSVNEEKQEKSRKRAYMKVEASLPDFIPRLLKKGNNKVAFDLLRILSHGARRPGELRAELGISSTNFFTAHYLTPLEQNGFIELSKGCSRFSPTKTFQLTHKGRRVVYV